MPAARFITSCERESSTLVSALQRELELLLDASARAARNIDRDEDAGNAGEPFADWLGQLLGRALSVLQRLQLEIEARLVLPLAYPVLTVP